MNIKAQFLYSSVKDLCFSLLLEIIHDLRPIKKELPTDFLIGCEIGSKKLIGANPFMEIFRVPFLFASFTVIFSPRGL